MDRNYKTKTERIELLKSFLLSNKSASEYYKESGVCYSTFLEYMNNAKAYLRYKLPDNLKINNQLVNLGNFISNNKRDKYYYLDAINSFEQLNIYCDMKINSICRKG